MALRLFVAPCAPHSVVLEPRRRGGASSARTTRQKSGGGRMRERKTQSARTHRFGRFLFRLYWIHGRRSEFTTAFRHESKPKLRGSESASSQTEQSSEVQPPQVTNQHPAPSKATPSASKPPQGPETSSEEPVYSPLCHSTSNRAIRHYSTYRGYASRSRADQRGKLNHAGRYRAPEQTGRGDSLVPNPTPTNT